jgi:hypothetical protein
MAGTAYSQTLAATGGSGTNLSWSVTSGSSQLTAIGLSLSSAGVLSGSAPVAGTAAFGVNVTDSASNTATASFTVSIYSALTLPAANPSSLPSGSINQAYTGAINASGGSGSGYLWSINGTAVPTNGTAFTLTDGLSASSSGGNTLTISGTPTTAGVVTLTNVTVKDSANDTAGSGLHSLRNGELLRGINRPDLPGSGA